MNTYRILSTIFFFFFLFNSEESFTQESNQKPKSSLETEGSLGDIIYKSYFNIYDYNDSRLKPLESTTATWYKGNLPDCKAAYSVAVDSINKKVFVGTWQPDTSIGCVFQTTSEQILSDNEVIWNNLPPIPGEDHVLRLVYNHPTNTLFALGLNSPYRYIEATNTWKRIISPVEIYRTYDMQQGSNNRIFVCFQEFNFNHGYSKGWVGQIIPGQDTLQNLSEVPVQIVQTITEGHNALWVVGGNLSGSWLFKSNDGGITWPTVISLPEPNQIAWDMYPDSLGANPTMWLATNKGIYLYNPMGIIKVRADGLPTETRCVTVSPNDSVYAGTSGIGADVYQKMSVWKPLGVSPDLITAWDILFFENNMFVVGTERIVYPTYYYYRGGIWFRQNSVIGIKYSDQMPSGFKLRQNYPNPFNPITTIEFDLPEANEVILKIFNSLGEEVTTLVSDRLSAGSYLYRWEASQFASGVYLYRLQAGAAVETKKMMLMK